jgi:hypothetical protein
VADVAAKLMRPDSKPTSAIENATAPGALVDQAVGGARIGKRVQRWQWHLHQAGRDHGKSPPTQ